MGLRGPNVDDVKALHDSGDIAGMVRLFATSRRRDVRRAIVAALTDLEAREALLEMLADDELQRQAAAALVEVDGGQLDRVMALTEADDATTRAGALYAVYYYARYRDMPEALAALRALATRDQPADMAQAAGAMAQKVEGVAKARRELIDKQLMIIADCLQQEQFEPASIVTKMYSSKRRERLDAMRTIVALRYSALPYVITKAPDHGDTVLAILLAMAINEIGASVVSPVAAALADPDKRTRSVMLRTLICLRQARIPGAAEAIESSGMVVTEAIDRSAAKIYREWVRD